MITRLYTAAPASGSLRFGRLQAFAEKSRAAPGTTPLLDVILADMKTPSFD